MPIAHLTDRAVLSVSGEDAVDFLGGLVTCAVDAAGGARYGALLTPQGKIIADFMLAPRSGAPGGFLIDVPGALAETLLKRLAMYRLRAKVALADALGEFGVAAAWGDAPDMPDGFASFADPRWAGLGRRMIGPPAGLAALADAAPADYDAHRVGLAIPRGGVDFAYGDAFPHEACIDQLGGVDFDKGCYVGQEVVSRTQHRGTARTRVVALRFPGAAPAQGETIEAGGKPIGRVGSVDAGASRGVGLARLDRLADALTAGETPVAAGQPVEAVKPAWARYPFPEAGQEQSR